MTRDLARILPLPITLAVAFCSCDARAVGVSEAGKIEEIVVTAQRRAEPAQNIGVALSVLSAEALQDAGVADVRGIQNATPSLEIEPAFGSDQSQFRLRGVGFIDYTSNNSSPVGVSFDGVSLPFPIQTSGQLFDVARVEVLRGPQGTLYGRNTTGGALNFISNPPTAESHAAVDLSYGSHNAFDGEAFVSGSLGKDLKGRLAVATEQGGAWQENRQTGVALGNHDKIAARGQLEWQWTDRSHARIVVHTSRDQSDAYGLQLFSAFTPTSDPTHPLAADSSPYATGWSLRPEFAAANGIAAGSKPGVNNSNSGGNLELVVDFGESALTSITGYNLLNRRELNDWDATGYAESDVYFRSEAHSFSQEVRLASNGERQINWVTGVYYSDDRLHESFNNDFAQRLGGAARTEYAQSGRTTGVFGNSTIRISENLKGILGLRYTEEKRSLDGLTTLFAVGNPINFSDIASASNPTGLTFNLSGGSQRRSISDSGLSGKIGIEYRLGDRQLLYASLSRGEKSGGFTAHNTLTAGAVDPFKPERLTSFEIGSKNDISDKIRLNASAFHYEYRDQQILSKIFDAVSQSYVGRFVNAPKSRIDGAELELEWTPFNNLQISQYFGYKKGKFTSTIRNSSDVDFNGAEIDFPKASYGGKAAFIHAVGEFNVRYETNYSYRDKYPQIFLLGPEFTNDSYWLVNASVTLEPVKGRWAISAWAKNVTNQKYYLTKNFFLPGTNVAAAGEPTTLGIRFKWSY